MVINSRAYYRMNIKFFEFFDSLSLSLSLLQEDDFRLGDGVRDRDRDFAGDIFSGVLLFDLYTKHCLVRQRILQ